MNIKGVFNCISLVIFGFKEKNRGVIINMVFIVFLVVVVDRFVYLMIKGVVLIMIYFIVKDYLVYNIWCNCIFLVRIYMLFVDGFIVKNYFGKEKEMFENLLRM